MNYYDKKVFEERQGHIRLHLLQAQPSAVPRAYRSKSMVKKGIKLPALSFFLTY